MFFINLQCDWWIKPTVLSNYALLVKYLAYPFNVHFYKYSMYIGVPTIYKCHACCFPSVTNFPPGWSSLLPSPPSSSSSFRPFSFPHSLHHITIRLSGQNPFCLYTVSMSVRLCVSTSISHIQANIYPFFLSLSPQLCTSTVYRTGS